MKPVFLASLLLALGCSSSPKKPDPVPGGGGSGTEPSHTACSSDADCVVVETACCDHCNGGKAEAFHKDHAAAHKPTGCEQTACTMMACGAATATCEAGSCKVTIAPLE